MYLITEKMLFEILSQEHKFYRGGEEYGFTFYRKRENTVLSAM